MKNRIMLKKLVPYVMSACLLTFAAACGDDNDDDGIGGIRTQSEQEREEQEREEQRQPDQGLYAIALSPLNADVAGNVTGTGTIEIQGDQGEINMVVLGAPEGITHIQHIHAGDECPTAADDANGDGYVDVVEGVPDYGPILIPLDDNIEVQIQENANFPTAGEDSERYVYEEEFSLTRLLADLRAPDPDPEDAVIKLPADEDLDLTDRHVVIHGVPESANLPDSVASIGGAPNHATLPIACGVITRVPVGGGKPGGIAGGATGGTTGETDDEPTGGTNGGTTGAGEGGTVGTTIGGTIGGTISGGDL